MWTAVVLVLGLGACRGALADAVAQFEAGEYPAAKRGLELLEGEAGAWSLSRRARYALYRGLTLDALGDAVHAAVWVRAAAAIEEGHPGALSSIDARRLDLVTRTLCDESP